MITKHERHISYICPVCHTITTRVITPFVFSGRKSISVRCTHKGCDTICLNMHDQKGAYIIESGCMLCGGPHSVTINKGQFWSNPLTAVKCDDSGIDIMFVGEHKHIKPAWEKFQHELDSLEGEQEGFFYDFEPDTDDEDLADRLYALVDILSILTELNELHCKCGSNNVSFTIIDNKIGFSCSSCHSVKIEEPTEELIHRLSDAAPYTFNS